MPTDLNVFESLKQQDPVILAPIMNVSDTEWWLPCDGRTMAFIWNRNASTITVTLQIYPTTKLGRGANDTQRSLAQDEFAYIGPLTPDGFEDPARPGWTRFSVSDNTSVLIWAIRV